MDIENYDCPLREWITRERTKIEIRKKFSRFLRRVRSFPTFQIPPF